MGFVKAVKNFSRLRELANILWKEGFGEIVARLGLKTHLPFEERVKSEKFKKNPKSHLAMHLRRVMENAGGAYVKLGQMLSLRGDLIPTSYCDEFAKLQDQVRPIAFIQVKKVVEAEFGKPLDKIFKEFDEKPIAAASIAQVHKAKLKNGKVVAVKVQRPRVAKAFRSDIQLLYYIASQAEKYVKEIKPFNPSRIVSEFESYTRNELDFLSEARNIDSFYEKYKYSRHIKIPRVYWDYTTSRVITMSFLDGKKVSSIKSLKDSEKKRIAMVLYNSYLTQVFDMKVFHADPHPGNLLIMKDGKIAFLDFGIVGRLSPDLSDNMERMMIALVKGDIEALAYSFIDLGVVEQIDVDKFKEDLFSAWAPYHNKKNSEINMKKFFAESFSLARRYKIEYPGNFVLLAKASITVQSVGEKLYPDANFVEVVAPKVEEILRRRHSPREMFRSARRSAYDLAWTLRKFPQDLRTLLHMVKTGTTVRVDIDNKDLKRFTREMDRSSNRITYGLVMSGLLVGTALIILAQVPPVILRIPLLAWFGFFIIGLLSLMLTVSILRENRGGD